MSADLSFPDPSATALLLVDLQNDFIHPDGAYARGGAKASDIAALPARLAPLAHAVRARGGWIVSTHFTLVAGKGGEPLISPHLKAIRPFLTKGDFVSGGWGHDVVEALQPIDIKVEKVAFSAFYMSRLEWVLRKAGITSLIVGGIVTNGGVASTVRDAHVRDLDTVVLEDGCAAFSDQNSSHGHRCPSAGQQGGDDRRGRRRLGDGVMAVLRREAGPEAHVPVLVVGAGACGLIAGLAAHDAGAEVLVLERDPVPSGSTSLSAGYIPACGTRWQREAKAEDDVDRMLGDIQRKNHDEGDPVLGRAVCTASGPALEWLADAHGQAFVLETKFLYPGHTAFRMHAHPEKTGAALVGSLAAAVERAGIDIVCEAAVRDLLADADGRILGVVVERPDGSTDEIGCDALVLACNGYGGNPEMLRTHIPEMADALYFGHAGNRGDAVNWGPSSARRSPRWAATRAMARSLTRMAS
ncbi:MAG: isochorismatase family protein [Thalassobaculum sp.]